MTNTDAASDAVILISLDTLRADCFGAPKNPLWKRDYPDCTQRDNVLLQELATQGTLFANTITAAPYTAASHAAILTGCWPLRNGVKEVFRNPLAVDSLFAKLRALSFTTALQTDFPLILGHSLGFTRGVDSYIIEDEQRFIDTIGDGPFFGLCHFSGAHYPYGFHKLSISGDAYRTAVAHLEQALPLDLDETPDRIFETYRDGEDRDLLIRYKRIIKHLFDSEQWDRIFQLYLDGIEVFLEHRFRPFFDALKRKLAGRRALIVIFGDHGEHWSADSYGHHNSMREGVLRVPVLFIGDGVQKGRSVTTRIRTVDVAPTVLDWLGIEDDDVDGSSLGAMLAGGPPDTPRTAFSQAWNCEPEEFVRVQQAAQTTPEAAYGLNHVLTGETVYHANYRMVRRYHAYSDGIARIRESPTEMVLEDFDENFVPHSVTDATRLAALTDRLGGLLDAYNAIQPARSEQSPAPLEGDLRKQLADFGYRII